MKKMNKKGFTIVELVIVIAVIAILAAVLIPTFSGIVTKAQESAVKQEVTSAFKEALAIEIADDGTVKANDAETVNGYAFTWTTDDDFDDASCSFTAKYGYNGATIANGVVTLTPAS